MDKKKGRHQTLKKKLREKNENERVQNKDRQPEKIFFVWILEFLLKFRDHVVGAHHEPFSNRGKKEAQM